MIKLKALIVSNGDIKDINNLKEIGKACEFILSADGGANYCLQASLIPNIVIGDLDSISKETLKRLNENKVPIEKFPVKKDATDTELAIDYLIEKGFKDIIITGAIGSRMDHTLANILLLKKLYDKNIKGRIVNKNNTIYLIDKELILNKKEGFYVSVIPITEKGAIISLKGFEYELNRIKINFGTTQGISNYIVADKGYINIYEGKCLVFVSKD